ncbi:TPA: hypothetical protein ACH3X2_005169 [Trebouxia sp. C0005]
MANMSNALIGAFPAGNAYRVIPQRQHLSPQRRSHGVTTVCSSVRGSADDVFLLDYGAGNVRSVRNAVKRLGFHLRDVQHVDDISKASRLIFPGVGAYGQAMDRLKHLGYVEALRDYIQSGKPFLGICLGLQLMFDGSTESGGIEGLGIVSGAVSEFDRLKGLPVPHIGWNSLQERQQSRLLADNKDQRFYFVHSYRATPSEHNKDWVLASSHYGEDFVAALQKGDTYATQFHPEKSGAAGLALLKNFFKSYTEEEANPAPVIRQLEQQHVNGTSQGLAKRVIACLDVRANDAGDLVVTKGDQYDVRDKGTAGTDVRNLGLPVQLAGRYFVEGADEVTFLNITGFRDFPLGDLPMLEVVRQASEGVFVPLTVGGGIKEFTDADGKHWSALEVASEYFRSGADKVSIGGDAVVAAEEYRRTGQKTGTSSIEQISWAVVVSIDPKRVYVKDPVQCSHNTVKLKQQGPHGEEYCWYQCTVKGGREARDIDAVQLAQAVEALGAGEILLNSIDADGACSGFDLALIQAVSDAVTIPVIASSGAGSPEHFSQVFNNTKASAALAAGIFHRQEVAISDVKSHMAADGLPTRT